MSNYIFNDSFGGTESQMLSTVTKSNKKQFVKILFICTALIASSIILLTAILAFGAISNIIDRNGTPKVTHTTSYVSNDSDARQNQSESETSAIDTIKSSVVSVSTKTGAFGSGVIAGEFSDSNGKSGYYIVTNFHVISNHRSGLPAERADVVLNDGTKYTAELCGADRTASIAVLKIYESEKKLSCARWAQSNAQSNSGLIIIGSIGGGVFNLNGELIGIGVGEEIEEIDFISAETAFNAYERLTSLQYQRKLL